jgi:hypothetical protein
MYDITMELIELGDGSSSVSIGYNYLFTNKGVTVFRRNDYSFVFKCDLRGNIYLMDFISEKVKLDKCLIAKRNMD